MKIISFRIWILFSVSFLLFSCKKDSSSTNTAATLAFEKASYYPMEAAQINTNGLALSQANYTGTINGSSYTLSAYHGSLVLIMPVLSAGNYNLKLQIDGKEYTADFQLLNTPNVVNINPQAIINTQVFALEARITDLQTIANTLAGTKKTDLQTDISWLTTLKSKIQNSLDTMSNAEKINCAMVLQANSTWLNETFAAIDSFQSNSTNLRLMSDVEDYEQKVDRSVTDYLKPLFSLFVKNTPKILALAGTGALVGSEFPIIGTGIGATVGFGIGLALYISDAKKLLTAEDKLLDVTLEPLNDISTQNLRINSTLNYINNIPATLSITNDYRSTYKNDRTSTVPIIKDIVTYTDGVASLYNELNNLLPQPLSYDAPVIDDNTSYGTSNREVHSNYITITGISNSNVTVSIQKQGGRIVATFKTTASTDQDFTYKVQYNNSRFGNYSQTVNAHLTVNTFQTITDIDGNVYRIITIGTQVWMAENLKTSHYNDGGIISNITDNTQWGATTTGAYCYYNNDTSNRTIYGNLYNWYAVNTNKLAPIGWHVPTQAEWQVLADYLGGITNAGGPMKSTSALWSGGINIGATNSSGFSGLPGGNRVWTTGGYGNLGTYGSFWSATAVDSANAHFWSLYRSNTSLDTSYNSKNDGFSIRCIKD